MYEMNILDTKRDGEEIEVVVMVTFENIEPIICSKYQDHNYPGKKYIIKKGHLEDGKKFLNKLVEGSIDISAKLIIAVILLAIGSKK
ncbi:MAG: hypothetical protein L6V81_01385 [Clostridium sp.]|nr:MAG: hypothetical protein L6V81_01385 [Clostridium sp.]